jgi:uncharacterized BrkB/YihY/UPF0761 family membrane protein
MPLIKNFRGTTIWKAFFFGSLITSLVIILGILIKSRFDTFKDINGNEIKKISKWKYIFLNFLIIFTVNYILCTLLYFIFGFGYGNVAPQNI